MPVISLIDLGEARPVDQLPRPGEEYAMSFVHAAPGLICDRTPSVASDICALACTLHEIRAGQKVLP